MAVKGQIATSKEVKARWGFGEVLSEEFGSPYKNILPANVYDHIRKGNSFDDLDPNHWDILIQGLNTARLPSFTDGIDQYGSNGYICTEWSIDDLMKAKVIPMFGQVLYREFLTLPPERTKEGILNPADPRCRVWGVSLQPAFVQGEPLITVLIGAEHLLVEGYTRSLLWLRNPTNPLLVWTSIASPVLAARA